MNIVLAQLKKDIQCQRGPLIIWGVCLFLGVVPFVILTVFHHLHHFNLTSVFNFAGPQQATTGHAHNFELTDTQAIVGAVSYAMLFVMCMLAAAFGMFLLAPVLVIRTVHEDRLMGTTAFWLTRPIPRGQLLLAKVLFIAILPLPLLLAIGKGATVGTSQFWSAEIAWITTVAAISSITPGMREFLAYGVSLFFGKIVFSGIVDRLWSHYHGDNSIFPDGVINQFSAVGLVLHLNASDFFHLCYFVGFSAVFIHQYLTLRTRKSLAMLIAILVVVGLLQMLIGSLGDTPAALNVA